MHKRGRFVWYVCFLLALPFAAIGQNYGLRFRSHETATDSRTALDVTAAGSICFEQEMELSLGVRFREKGKGYYGYIWRILTSQGLNIDLVYKPSSPPFRFNLVIGKRASGLSFALDSLYNWNEIRLRLNADEDKITLITPDTVLYKENVGLAGNECLKIALGRSHVEGIRAVDLPPMVVRDLRIKIDGTPGHYWPLNESAGTVAHDILGGVDAKADNPEWIREEYQRWHLYREETLPGLVSLAFNKEDETVLILSNDSLISVPIGEGQRTAIPVGGDSNLVNHGDQAAYAAWSDKLVNINLDEKLISSFDFRNGTWERRYSDMSLLTRFWHHNKIMNPDDSSLITIGGYGRLTYQNLVQRYSFNTEQWDTLALQGDFIAPRYLAAMSSARHGVSYLIGGYGSTTGDQMLYPEHYQDLYRIDWEERRVKKIYELNLDREPYVFANSLIVENDSTWYGLIFPRFRSNSFLQLIRGSLKAPEYELMGDSIPFHFHDIYSYADLFLAEKSKALIAVNSHFDNARGLTTVAIHTIAFPPVNDRGNVVLAKAEGEDTWLKQVLVSIVLLLVTVIVARTVARRRSRRKGEQNPGGDPGADLTGGLEKGGDFVKPGADIDATVMIRFFGGFSVCNSRDEDLTAKFTPLLKELFILIALNTLRLGKGVPSSKLDELFWPDKSEKSARNNRSVNIAKLKAALAETGPIELHKNADKWTIDLDKAKVRIDYADYLSLIRRKGGLTREDIEELIRIVESGPLLSEVQYEWLDYFKSVTSTEIIEAVSGYISTIQRDEAFDHQIEIANFITVFDPVDEEAMHLQCTAFSRMGNHTLAKNAYEKFCREYFALYAEDYNLTFQQILEGKIPHRQH